MKARLLKKILNNTEYIINNNEDYIAVGSPYCHCLINVDKKTLQLKYALDAFREGRKSINDENLEFIWDKLQELIDNGQIKDIIEGQDEIENPLPVFTIDEFKIVESTTDKYGWPNSTINGDLMYDNTYFKTKEEAAEYGIRNHNVALQWYKESLKETKEKVMQLKNDILKYENSIKEFEEILNGK